MAKCAKRTIKKTKLCIGDTRHKGTIERREVQPVGMAGGLNPVEAFIEIAAPWFAIETIAGSSRRQGVNTNPDTTHFFLTRYNLTIARLDGDGEHFIKRKDIFYRIIKTHNLNELDTTLLFECAERGDDAQEASAA